MTDLTALPALLARVEAATGGDRELDAAIALTFALPQEYFDDVVDYQFDQYVDGPEYHVDKATWSGMGRRYTAPSFTTSLDATVALVKRRLKHAATVHLTINIGAAQHDCAIDLAENEEPGDAVTCRTPPLALLAALLRSMIEEEGK